jgi:hypothetical protein
VEDCLLDSVDDRVERVDRIEPCDLLKLPARGVSEVNITFRVLSLSVHLVVLPIELVLLSRVRVQVHRLDEFVHRLALLIGRQQRVLGDDLARARLVGRERGEPEVVLVLGKRQLRRLEIHPHLRRPIDAHARRF